MTVYRVLMTDAQCELVARVFKAALPTLSPADQSTAIWLAKALLDAEPES